MKHLSSIYFKFVGIILVNFNYYSVDLHKYLTFPYSFFFGFKSKNDLRVFFMQKSQIKHKNSHYDWALGLKHFH